MEWKNSGCHTPTLNRQFDFFGSSREHSTAQIMLGLGVPSNKVEPFLRDHMQSGMKTSSGEGQVLPSPPDDCGCLLDN